MLQSFGPFRFLKSIIILRKNIILLINKFIVLNIISKPPDLSAMTNDNNDNNNTNIDNI